MSDHTLPCQLRRIAALFFLLSGSALAQEVGTSAPERVAAEPASPQIERAQSAEEQFLAGDIAGGIRAHLELEAVLTGPARSANREALWKALNALPINTDFSRVSDPVAMGWVELMQLAKTGAPLSAYEDWRQRHPDHPAESQMAAGFVTTAAPLRQSREIALLLPMSGPLAAAAQAIKAGAQAALARAGTEAPGIALFDTTTGLDAAVAAAVAQGAAAMVGPLRKEDVASLAARSPQLPTITLNYLDGGRVPPIGLTPFGLAPEDEARAAAEHALTANRRRAVILAQDGDWGSRAAAAFKSQFETQGGTIVGEERYRSSTVDFTHQLKRLLGVTYPVPRVDPLAPARAKLDPQPVPRSDIDVVFLAAQSPQAKLIWPQMRYLRAGHIATYAPANAANGGSRDLGGLMVCDAPWRIASQGEVADIRSELSALNPRSAVSQRLFALGYDAYGLARQVSQHALTPGEPIAGLSGTLLLDAEGALHRRLDCVALLAPRLGDGE